MIRRATQALLLTLTLPGACATNPFSLAPASKPPPSDTAKTAQALFAPPAPQQTVSTPTRVVDIAFTVMNVDFAEKGSDDARKLWNHIDEMRLGPSQVQLLARNGLRLGAASPSSWPAIQTILDAGGAKITSSQLFPQRGFPLPIELGNVEEGASIFSYDAKGRLVGKTFSSGQKTVLIDYALHPQLDGCTDLAINFEITSESGRMVWQQKDGLLQQVPEQDRHRFPDLTSILTMQPGEFLVLGQRAEGNNQHLVGTQFLAGTNGPGSVRVTFVAPVPYQTQTATRPAS